MSLAADPAVSRQSLVSQVAKHVESLPSHDEIPTHDMVKVADFIKIASVDVSQASVHSALKSVAEKYPRVSEFLKNSDEENFVADTHVTMVHFSQMPQSTTRTRFEPLIGCAVDVTVTGIIWNEQIATFKVKVATETKDKPDVSVPAPNNSFVHMTLWHQPDVSPAYSNELPQLVESGKAEEIDFEEPVVLQGVVSLWGDDRG